MFCAWSYFYAPSHLPLVQRRGNVSAFSRDPSREVWGKMEEERSMLTQA